MLSELTRLRNRKTGRCSSWDRTGRNHDLWIIPPGESVVLADIARQPHGHIVQTGNQLLRMIMFEDRAGAVGVLASVTPVGGQATVQPPANREIQGKIDGGETSTGGEAC